MTWQERQSEGNQNIFQHRYIVMQNLTPLKMLSQNSDSIAMNLAPYHNIYICTPF